VPAALRSGLTKQAVRKSRKNAAWASAEQPRGAIEGDVGKDRIRLARQTHPQHVILADDHVVVRREPPSQARRKSRVVLDGDHPPTALRKPFGDDAAAGAEIEHQVFRTDGGQVQQPIHECAFVEKVLGLPGRGGKSLGHIA
jgi:hypothetical protein